MRRRRARSAIHRPIQPYVFLFYGSGHHRDLHNKAHSFPTRRSSDLPLIRPLSPMIARACAGLAQRTDTSWEELGVQLASEALGLANAPLAGTSNALPSAVARVTRAVRMIERQADGELALGSLAREAGLSPYHFLRTFQQLTGVTPHQYLRRLRLRKAAVRL